MYTIFFDSPIADLIRRQHLYKGHLFVYSSRPASVALCSFARELITEAFAGLDPTKAQYDLPTERYVSILTQLKPRFVHHPQSMKLVQDLLEDLGCDPANTYIDVPRLKSIPHGNDHPSGLTYAIHPHRDTWYSAPFCQLNWWLPIYDIDGESALAFHPSYWTSPVINGSRRFNHYRWNKYGRKMGAADIDQYVQDQPRPEEPIELDSQIRPIVPAGGILLFSGAQLHSAVQNTSGKTRFSIDFRTVHIDDVLAKAGAPNIDSASTGTTLRDFRRGTDISAIPDNLITQYDPEPVLDGELVFQPSPFKTI